MALNPEKSTAVLFGTSKRAPSYSSLATINVAGSSTHLAKSVKILGVTLDSTLSLNAHTAAVSKSCFYHIRALRRIRTALDDSMATTLASALVSSRLDYANSIYYSTSSRNITRLTRVQNALARVTTRSHQPSHSLLRQLHWLPIQQRISFKLATLTYKSIHTGSPSYLSELLQPHVPSRTLRSSSGNYLSQPRHKLAFGGRAFSVAAPKLWNSLPIGLRDSSTLSTFRRNLKTHLFPSNSLS